MESKNPNNMKNQGNTRFLSYSIIICKCAWNKITGIWQCYNKVNRSFIKTQQQRSKYLYVNGLRLQNICDAYTILKNDLTACSNQWKHSIGPNITRMRATVQASLALAQKRLISAKIHPRQSDQNYCMQYVQFANKITD